jgi:HAD superfamily hydrolase (TIGR01490 family)
VAFFDVDGTIVKTTIVHYYIYFRRRRMPAALGLIWHGAYLLKCGYYLALDKINRSRLNVVFYRGYRGLPVEEIKAQADDCYRSVIEPRYFSEAVRRIEEHRKSGLDVVLVTGSIDFIVKPLARHVGAQAVVACALAEDRGCFTGELIGPPVGDEEKARRIRQFAETRDIDLARCHAYGDSIADLPMLEAVGHPHAVNPDKALAAIARSRGWPVHRWEVVRPARSNGR